MDRKLKQKVVPQTVPAPISTPISIKSNATDSSRTTLACTTPSSLLSKSMQSSFKHEVFDFSHLGHGGSSSSSLSSLSSSTVIPVIVSTSGQGFQWNRDGKSDLLLRPFDPCRVRVRVGLVCVS